MLWNSQSVVNKADLIPAFAWEHKLQVLPRTEIWICPHRTATTAALSTDFYFSHSPRPTGGLGGTGLLISKILRFTQISANHASLAVLNSLQ